ncbi:hypothetical protein PTKIN_Ptkin11bG0019900 [Pterospermum kingtungense]
MASTCISNCINDTRVPIRPTYVNLYKWPESDAAFVRSLSSNGRAHPKVVDSISCRQMYLRSYTFHRNDQTDDDDDPEKTKCFGRSVVKNEIIKAGPRRKKKTKTVAKKKKKRVGLRRAKEVSCAALLAVFRRLLSCTAKVDVADHGRH